MQSANELHIGLALHNPQSTFYALLGYGARERAMQHDVRLSILPSISTEQQIAQIQRLVDQQVRALIVTPFDNGSRAAVSAVLRAAEAGGVLIFTCEGERSGLADRDIGSDLYAAAATAVTFLLDRLPDGGKVAHLQGRGSMLRAQGFRDTIAQFPELQVVFEGSDEWTAEGGERLMQMALAACPALDAVFTHNDAMALGALAAIAAAGRTGTLTVTTVDASGPILRALHEGRVSAALDLAPRNVGQLVIDTVLRALRGEQVPERTWCPVTLLTRDNYIEAILDDLTLLPTVARTVLEQDMALAGL